MAIIKRYSASEAEKYVGFDRTYFNVFREAGLLKGSKVGKNWKYDEEEINDFIRDIRGYEFETIDSIKFYAPYILAARTEKNKNKRG